jgi:hypothetical protein
MEAELETARYNQERERVQQENEAAWSAIERQANDWPSCCDEFKQHRLPKYNWLEIGAIFPYLSHVDGLNGRRIAWTFVTIHIDRPAVNPDDTYHIVELGYCPWCWSPLPKIGDSVSYDDWEFVSTSVTDEMVVDTVRYLRRMII